MAKAPYRPVQNLLLRFSVFQASLLVRASGRYSSEWKKRAKGGGLHEGR